MLGLAREEENNIRDFVKRVLVEADIAHGFEHTECVVDLAKKIGKDETADLRVVVPAAYLHDIVPMGRADNFMKHAEQSADEAGDFLEKIGLPFFFKAPLVKR
jgi:uncharacterized protein